MDGLIEEWRPIEGYEDLYMVSNLGNVKIIKNNKIRKLQQKNNGSCNKVRASDILRVCRGERTKAYGFTWRFK